MVNIVNDGRQIVACRSGNDDVLCACIDVCLCFCLGGIEACALQNDIYANLAPGKLSCVGLRINLDLFAVDCDGIFAEGNGISLLISALCAVILEQVCKHLGGCQIVDCYDLKTLSAKHLTESQTTNTTETVNCYFYCHFCSSYINIKVLATI